MSGVIAAGAAVGFVLGFLGAGGTVIGLPFLLLFSGLGGHEVLGTNAAGVAFIALCLLALRVYRSELLLREGIAFAIPGLVGIFLGVRLGLLFPGQRLILLVGFVLFLIAGWMFYLSTRAVASAGRTGEGPLRETASGTELSDRSRERERRRLLALIPTAFVIGAIAGFFAIGGGFMIVPGLILVGGLALNDAAATALLPIAAFASLVGLEYWTAGDVNAVVVGVMLAPGIAGGLLGIWMARRLSKRIMQRAFALLLVLIGVYMIVH
jgi:uncharacterized protein